MLAFRGAQHRPPPPFRVCAAVWCGRFSGAVRTRKSGSVAEGLVHDEIHKLYACAPVSAELLPRRCLFAAHTWQLTRQIDKEAQ